ncbi:FkbM family methyltransferase [Caulobacter sp. 17J65-9]|uniref:FkbM family methyltransferase n=1 Tax=Caulobacter sp. 17J65-9 TaxID=2709382 RepID=UPI0013C82277|nr:FkbM family methyltransferase [Caulobacter sp. 17J65-9]NEX94754.1 FkbM family methyltransferase [Caulobacter sp. 17J65-9]
MLSYAQLFEDVYLQRCFADQAQGFYIDVGACHPVHCNTTYHFYQRGWAGVNAEPTPHRLLELERARPRDVNLRTAVGRADGRAVFNVSVNADHLSSLREQPAALIDRHGAHIERLEVEVITLASLCERHAPGPIDFLKIDVEGAEADVIAGADWRRWRPALLVIEATLPDAPEPAWADWEPALLAADYAPVFFDGVNRYYVAAERAELGRHFLAPANPFDGAVALHSFGPALDDRRHPDHAWARNFVDRVLAAAAIEDEDHLLRLMTWDLSGASLDAPASEAAIALAYQRVLGRAAEAEALAHWAGREELPLRRLYRELVAGEEFRTRRSRVSTRSMWR